MTAPLRLPRLRGVVFDLDGTLYRARPLRLMVMADLAWRLPLSGPWRASRTLRILRSFRRIHEELRRGLDRGGQPLDVFHHAETARRAEVSVAEAEQTVDRWMRQRVLGPVRWSRRRGLRPTFEWLRGQGARLAVYSDYPAADKVASLGIDDLVDVIAASTDVDIDALKPDPRGFQVVAEKLGIPPGELCYVGDRPEVDLVGAAAAGMPAVLMGRDPARADSAPEVGDLAALRRLLEPSLPASG